MRPAVLFVAVLAMLATLFTAAPALADPPVNPSDTQIGAATASQQALAAQLGSLQARAVELQGRIDALRASADGAIARYQQTTRDVAAALDAADAAKSDLDAAHAEVDATRRQLQLIARDMYVSGTGLDRTSALLFATDASDIDFRITASTYLADRRDAALDSLTVANVEAANAEAARRSALTRAEDLQRQADGEQQQALASLETARVTEVQLQATLTTVNQQAAAASAALSGLLDQRAAYDAYLAEVARQEAARKEAARQAAIRAAQAAATRNAGGGSGSGSGSGSGGGSGGTVVTAPPPAPGGSWVRPLTSYRISSCYCARWGTFHHGVDLSAPLGTPIYAVGPGRVVASGPASGFGNWVVIDHHDGSYSIYGHMRVLVARVGQDVGAGTLIAYVGSEGESTGAHLHFEVRIGNYGSSSNSTDPIIWLRQRGVTL